MSRRMCSETSNPNSPLLTSYRNSLPLLLQGSHLSVSFICFSHTRISSHTAIMNMEIQLLHETFPGKGPKLLVDHIRRMGSGEAPFFSTTLSLVYDKLAEKTVARSVPSGSGLGKSVETQETAVETALPQVSTFTLPAFWLGGATSSSSQAPVPTPAPTFQYITSNDGMVWLVCHKCRVPAFSGELYERVRCPRCPPRDEKRGRPFMQCQSCGEVRARPNDKCARNACKAQFR